MLGSIKDAFHRWAKRMFHRSDKRRSHHSTSDQGRISSYPNQNPKVNGATKRNLVQPSSKLRNLPQATSALGTGTNADEQHTAPISPVVKGSYQPSSTLDAQASSTKEGQAPFFGRSKSPASPQCSRNVISGSQLADAAVSKNQPQSLNRKPLAFLQSDDYGDEFQGTQEGYPKLAWNRKEANKTLSQGSSYNPPSKPPHRKLSLGKSLIRDKEVKAESRDKNTNDLTAVGSDSNHDGVEHYGHHEVYIDRSVHPRPAVIQEEIKPHIHTVYEPRRTRSIHLHEHHMLIQPIVDPTS